LKIFLSNSSWTILENEKRLSQKTTTYLKIKKKKKPFDKTIYKSTIGSPIYLSKYIWPEISFSLNKASKEKWITNNFRPEKRSYHFKIYKKVQKIIK